MMKVSDMTLMTSYRRAESRLDSRGVQAGVKSIASDFPQKFERVWGPRWRAKLVGGFMSLVTLRWQWRKDVGLLSADSPVVNEPKWQDGDAQWDLGSLQRGFYL
jgi:hypothetical protein